MKILDNVNKTVKDDLAVAVSKGDKISIATACFSIYPYETLVNFEQAFNTYNPKTIRRVL